MLNPGFDRYYELRKLYDDTLAVDAIFDRAMLIADGNVKHALLISTLAVMDHQKLGFKVPIIGSVYFPLTSENDLLFRLLPPIEGAFGVGDVSVCCC